jgi:enoyl-[acyl-carrier-protein] reductase (NADH)
MAKELTKDQVIELRVNLENEVNEAQQALADSTYSIDLENIKNINALLKQIDSTYNWTIKNAALVINLYDNLKVAKAAIRATDNTEVIVEISGMNLNTLYQVLTNIEGTGIESARTFTRLLANVGSQISASMEEMAESNREIQKMHVELAELDAKVRELSEETVSADEIA